ncbi:hypothetical protein PInf_019849 [Phytophthora infestans]|nr:hypothetical protein PInf_019849 [Phytophthora infestans]
MARQYYYAHRRSDESPLEYLHQLNVADLRAKLKIKDGGSKVLREHVDHFIETLGDVDPPARLNLLRLPDADELEEVLWAVDRAKHHQKIQSIIHVIYTKCQLPRSLAFAKWTNLPDQKSLQPWIYKEEKRAVIGGNGNTADGMYRTTRIKITLSGCLVYLFDIWVGDLAGPDTILGMDFMVPAGVRLDLVDATLCFLDEMRIQLSGRRPLYGAKMRNIRADKTTWIEPKETWELPDRMKWVEQEKPWVPQGEKWVPTVIQGPGGPHYLQVTNVATRDYYWTTTRKLGDGWRSMVSLGDMGMCQWDLVVIDNDRI